MDDPNYDGRILNTTGDTTHPHDTYAPIKHHITNSTRCELAALTPALLQCGPAHIATDSRSALTIASGLAESLYVKARSFALSNHVPIQQALQHTANTTPSTAPWTLQKDGDLKRAWWRTLAFKNPRAVRITKVKAHTTQAQLEQGLITPRARAANKRADDLADEGVASHSSHFKPLHQHLELRAHNYTNLVARIQRFIVAILREDQHYRQAHHDLTDIAVNTTPTVNVATALLWPTNLANHITIRIGVPTLRATRVPIHLAQIYRVAKIFHNMTIQPLLPDQPGITWLELLIAYEHQHGPYDPPPDDVRTGLPKTYGTAQNAQALLRAFKRTVRFLIKHTTCEEVSQCFLHSTVLRKRFSTLATPGSQPSLPWLPASPNIGGLSPAQIATRILKHKNVPADAFVLAQNQPIHIKPRKLNLRIAPKWRPLPWILNGPAAANANDAPPTRRQKYWDQMPTVCLHGHSSRAVCPACRSLMLPAGTVEPNQPPANGVADNPPTVPKPKGRPARGSTKRSLQQQSSQRSLHSSLPACGPTQLLKPLPSRRVEGPPYLLLSDLQPPINPHSTPTTIHPTTGKP